MLQAGRWGLVILILALVITGLNISNEGMNQLTGEQRKEITAVDYGPEHISFLWLGQEYNYPRENLHKIPDNLRERLQNIPSYLTRIGRISNVLIFEPVREKLLGP